MSGANGSTRTALAEAQRSLIGEIMLDRFALVEVMGIIPQGQALFDGSLAEVWAAIEQLWARGEAVDPMTIAAEMERSAPAAFTSVGQLAGLIGLTGGIYTTSRAPAHARLILEAARIRCLRDACRRWAAEAELGERNSAEILAGCQGDFLVLDDRLQMSQVASALALADQATARRRANAERGGEVLGVQTGLADLDRLTLGLHPAELIVLAARPGIGKTALALQIAARAAADGAGGVLFFSLEMSGEMLMMRLLAVETGYPLTAIRRGGHLDDPREVLALQRIKALRLEVDDQGALSIGDLRARAHGAHHRAALGLVVVDYLQLLHVPGQENRQQEIATIARGLKQLAKELRVPVLALSQLNRRIEHRVDRRPALSDLRESGEIEASADLVMFLHRTDPPADGQTVKLNIAKHRNGPQGEIDLGWDGPCTRFAGVYHGAESR